jgi:hypothetical protein
MPAHAYRRIMAGERMPGVLAVGPHVPIAVAIEEILLIETCSELSEWKGQVRYLPL